MPNSDNEALLKELRLQTAILKAGFKEGLSELASSVRDDEISGAALEILEAGPLSAGAIRAAIAKKVNGAADRTISRRLASMVELGVLHRSGQGSQITYELTGII